MVLFSGYGAVTVPEDEINDNKIRKPKDCGYLPNLKKKIKSATSLDPFDLFVTIWEQERVLYNEIEEARRSGDMTQTTVVSFEIQRKLLRDMQDAAKLGLDFKRLTSPDLLADESSETVKSLKYIMGCVEREQLAPAVQDDEILRSEIMSLPVLPESTDTDPKNDNKQKEELK